MRRRDEKRYKRALRAVGISLGAVVSSLLYIPGQREYKARRVHLPIDVVILSKQHHAADVVITDQLRDARIAAEIAAFEGDQHQLAHAFLSARAAAVSNAPLAPGLYLVATPIGNARDITLRALDVLRGADLLAAEDTRTARRLLDIHGVPLAGRPLVPYHDHNGPQMRPRLLADLAEGRSVAFVSDAGTPLVADPGYRLAAETAAAGLPVIAVPGPSAVLAALAVAGLPSDRFLFAGFPPPQPGPRRRWLEELAGAPATLVMFESAKDVHEAFRTW